MTSMLVYQRRPSGSHIGARQNPAGNRRDGKINGMEYAPEASLRMGTLPTGPQDSLYVATGEPATITPHRHQRGRGSVLYEFDQSHIRSLAYHPLSTACSPAAESTASCIAPPMRRNFRALYDTGNTEITAYRLWTTAAPLSRGLAEQPSW